MVYKVADVLLKRKLCTFEEIPELIKSGSITFRASNTCELGGHKLLIEDPNESLVIPENGFVSLYVKNRGNTKIYDPYFEGEFLTATNYDYGNHRWEVIERSNAIVAVPVLDGTNIVLAQIYRPVFSEWLFEVPAGMMDPWESAHDTALRELEEETGYTAGRVDSLFTGYSTPGYSTEQAHFYLCTDLTPGEQKLDAEEEIIPLVVPISIAFDMIQHRKIKDMKTIAAITFLMNYTGEKPTRPLPNVTLEKDGKPVNIPCVQSDLIL